MTRNSIDRWLLVGSSLLAILSVGVLWQFKDAPQVCPAIYPVPDWCTAPQTPWRAVVAIALVLSLLSAIYIVYFTAGRPRIALIALAGGMLFVILIALAVAIAGMGGGIIPTPIPVD